MIIVVLATLAGTATQAGPVESTVIPKLGAALPPGWRIVATNRNVLPEGHYWGQTYSGPLGDEVVIEGVDEVAMSWRDFSGTWRQDVVGKEALNVYVMPPSYRESYLRFLVLKRPRTARLVVRTKAYAIYAHPSARITRKELLDTIVRQAKGVRWPDSPTNTGVLSWGSWSTDLEQLLATAVAEPTQ
jgi:hypothetical protein